MLEGSANVCMLVSLKSAMYVCAHLFSLGSFCLCEPEEERTQLSVYL